MDRLPSYQPDQDAQLSPLDSTPGQSIDWYSPGQSRTIDVGGMPVTIRFVGRKGRRARIAIEAPAGAVFKSNLR